MALVAEVNAKWPVRDKGSDGTIGDASHFSQGSASDHNPWVIVSGVGVVRARDIDRDGIDAAWLAEYLRTLGSAADPRLVNGGYVIYNNRITAPNFSTWRVYTGSDPHTSHIHVSFSRDQVGFDSSAAWGISSAQTGTVTPEEDDLTPEQAAALNEVLAISRNVNAQIFGGPGNGNPPGWPTFQNGSGETLTVVDYLRRQNARTEDLFRALANSSGVNPDVLAQAILRSMGSMVYDAVVQALGKGNENTAIQVVQLISDRLSKEN